MGYTTEFTGTFKVEPAMDEIMVVSLRNYADAEKHHADSPRGYCQWVPTEDGTGIEWDGNEKFYNYIEWLADIIKHFIVPEGRVMSGEVWWSGEDTKDVGIIIVTDNVISTKEPWKAE